MDPSTTCLPPGAGQHNFQIKKISNTPWNISRAPRNISNTRQGTFLGHLKEPSNQHQEPFPTQIKTFATHTCFLLEMGKWVFQDWICNSYRAYRFEILYESIVYIVSSIVETKLSIRKYFCEPFMKISTDTSNSKLGWALSCYQKDISFGLCLCYIACFSKFSDITHREVLGWFHVKHEQVLCIWDD